MHVCVIGAGVVGLTTAYFLQADGHTVTVLERADGAGRGASAANGAQLSYSYVAPLADASVPPKLASLVLSRDSPLKLHLSLDRALWSWGWQFLRLANHGAARATTAALLALSNLSREFIEPLIEGERIRCDLTRGGKLVVYPDRASVETARAQVQYQVALNQGRAERQSVLTPEECVLHEPAIAGYASRIAGGVWTPDDAAADCGAFCIQLASLLVQRGVEFGYQRTVERLDIDNGQLRALIAAGPEGSAPVRADAFVLAAGSESAALGAMAGLKLPVFPLKGYSITIKPDTDMPLKASITDARRKVVFAPLGDRVRVAGFVEIGGDPSSVPPARIAALIDAAREVLGYRIIDGAIHPWTGLRPATPSGRPILGRTPVRGLYLNVGHGALGWTLAAGSARLIADVIAGRAPTIDVAPFSYR
jgi:D-amino-acid dehydrogenase